MCVAAIRRCYTLAMADDGSDPPEWKRNACRGRYASRELDPRRVPMGLYSGMVGVLAGLALGQAFYRHVPLALAASGRLAWLRALVGGAELTWVQNLAGERSVESLPHYHVFLRDGVGGIDLRGQPACRPEAAADSRLQKI